MLCWARSSSSSKQSDFSNLGEFNVMRDYDSILLGSPVIIYIPTIRISTSHISRTCTSIDHIYTHTTTNHDYILYLQPKRQSGVIVREFVRKDCDVRQTKSKFYPWIYLLGGTHLLTRFSQMSKPVDMYLRIRRSRYSALTFIMIWKR